MERLRAGIIGLGAVGQGYDADRRFSVSATHASAYLASGAFELAAVSDTNPQAIERFVRARPEFHGACYGSPEEMLSAHRLDVVSLCVPTPEHEALFARVVEARPRCILAEKPFGAGAGSARRMADLAAAAGITVVVNYHRQWDRLHREILARLRQADAADIFGYYSGGLRHNGSHMIRFLNAAFGAPTELRCADGRDVLHYTAAIRACLMEVPAPTYTLECRFAGESIRMENGGRLMIWDGNDRHVHISDWVGGLDEAVNEIAEHLLRGGAAATNTCADAIAVHDVVDKLEAGRRQADECAAVVSAANLK